MLRQKLARVYLEAELLKLISDRAISAELHGRGMGPEGSIAKLVWSETEQHLTEVASDVLGPDALSGTWARDRVYSRALTIAGGTTQVNKNILAQRILGLPRYLTRARCAFWSARCARRSVTRDASGRGRPARSARGVGATYVPESPTGLIELPSAASAAAVRMATSRGAATACGACAANGSWIAIS